MLFIEVKRITKDNTSKNVLRDETIRISDIKGFRPWFKSSKEADIQGEITMLLLDSPDVQEDANEDKKKMNSILINEPYKEFLNRMNGVVIVR